MNFEDELMKLELRAKEAGVSRDDIITGYEVRKMAIEEESDEDEEDVDGED